MALIVDTNDCEAANRICSISNDRGLLLLILIHLVVCCISLICVALIDPGYYVLFHRGTLPVAVVTVAAFAAMTTLFAGARFSFGYFVGYYFFSMITGYLWLNCFSQFGYNHKLSGLSAAASELAFLLPALYRPSFPRIMTLSPKAFERLLTCIVLIGAAVAAIGAWYDFRMVSISDIYQYRQSLTAPPLVNYLTGITTTALLPFAFACFALQRRLWRTGLVLALLLLFYPVTLSKQAFFAPLWLVIMLMMTRTFKLRLTVVLSLLTPTALGVMLFTMFQLGVLPQRLVMPYFSLVNLRMMAMPSLAMDYYNEFFFAHDVTNFCQISFLKHLVHCPYQEPLAVVIYKSIGTGGYMNASLFATEGVASVGPLFAPLSALICGLVISVVNGLTAGLPQRYILVSGALLPQTLLNVPLTTAMLTHGAAVLFLLWYVMPRPLPAESNTAVPTKRRGGVRAHPDPKR